MFCEHAKTASCSPVGRAPWPAADPPVGLPEPASGAFGLRRRCPVGQPVLAAAGFQPALDASTRLFAARRGAEQVVNPQTKCEVGAHARDISSCGDFAAREAPGIETR